MQTGLHFKKQSTFLALPGKVLYFDSKKKKEAFREKGCLRERTALPTTQALLQTSLIQHRLSGQNRREQPDMPVESGRQLLNTHGQDVLKMV